MRVAPKNIRDGVLGPRRYRKRHKGSGNDGGVGGVRLCAFNHLVNLKRSSTAGPGRFRDFGAEHPSRGVGK